MARADSSVQLEKIEASARQALGETRRLLGVLHHPDEENRVAPPPGIGDLVARYESLGPQLIRGN